MIQVSVDGAARSIEADQRPTHLFADNKEIVVCRINGALKDLWTDLEEGDVVEPIRYYPIIPMILINGSEGIGTGYSTNIPPFNPLDIIKNIKRLIKGKEMKSIDPWWKGFEGTVVKIDDHNYEIHGNYTIKKNKVIITELPVGEWTSNYKEFLEKFHNLFV